MRLKAALIALTVIIVGPASANLQMCWIKDHCDAYVGKRLWVAIPAGNPSVIEVTFKRGDWTPSRTLKLKTGASFVVQGLDKSDVGSPDYRIRLDDGRIGWARISSPFLVGFDPIARAKKRGR